MHRKFKVAKRRDIDMTEGSIFSKILAFSVPLMATGILQLLFNAADMAVVGKYVSETALAAVGSTGSLVSLIVNFFIGLSAGAGVIMSKYFGSKDEEAGEKLLHTAMPIGLISGVLVAVAGALLSNTLLIVMNTPENCLGMANEYLVIYFIGAPFNLVYNFGASMLRSTGDTVRPLIYLSIAGVINIIVNLISVIVFNMGVSGVAYATITSQAVSAVLVVRALRKNQGFARLSLRKLCIHKASLLEILRLGIPSGVQSSLFSVSNMVIQGTINTFGDIAMAGNAAARQIEGFVYVVLNSVANAAVTAVGQNYGARNYKRIRKCIIECLTFVLTLGIVSGMAIMLFSKPLINIT